jgi:hypothetical protein
MSTEMSHKQNGCYSISAQRFYGGEKKGMMAMIAICNGDQSMCLSLTKQDVIDFCATIISMMNELGE